MAAQLKETKPNGISSKLRVVLFGSLALNLLFIGLMAGAAFRHGGGAEHGRPKLDRLSGPMVQALSRKDRRVIGRSIRESNSGMPMEPLNMDSIIKVLKQVPFDPNPIEAELVKQKNRVDSRQEFARNRLLERLSEISDAERAAFADRLEDELARAQNRREKWRKTRDRD